MINQRTEIILKSSDSPLSVMLCTQRVLEINADGSRRQSVIAPLYNKITHNGEIVFDNSNAPKDDPDYMGRVSELAIVTLA